MNTGTLLLTFSSTLRNRDRNNSVTNCDKLQPVWWVNDILCAYVAKIWMDFSGSNGTLKSAFTNVNVFWHGQAVSEMLYPPVDPSPDQRLSDSAVPPPLPPATVSTPQQTPVLQSDMHNSAEVISQLLRETEGELQGTESIDLCPVDNCGDYILAYKFSSFHTFLGQILKLSPTVQLLEAAVNHVHDFRNQK